MVASEAEILVSRVNRRCDRRACIVNLVVSPSADPRSSFNMYRFLLLAACASFLAFLVWRRPRPQATTAKHERLVPSALAVGLVIGGFVAYFRLTAAGWTWLDALLVSVVASAVSAMIGMVVLAIQRGRRPRTQWHRAPAPTR